jgi:hypothetical protein
MNVNFYAGTLGELVIAELCVLWIWFKVMIDALKSNDGTIINRRLVLISIGLVLNSVAITGVMAFRIHELITGNWPFVWGVVAFYLLMAAAALCLLVAASIGTSARLLKVFVLLTVLWTGYLILSPYFK